MNRKYTKDAGAFFKKLRKNLEAWEKHTGMKLKLDAEEKSILASYEPGEWKSVANLKEEKTKARRSASATLKKSKRILGSVAQIEWDQGYDHKTVRKR